jgi:hypothetical protein
VVWHIELSSTEGESSAAPMSAISCLVCEFPKKGPDKGEFGAGRCLMSQARKREDSFGRYELSTFDLSPGAVLDHLSGVNSAVHATDRTCHVQDKPPIGIEGVINARG